MNILVTGGAGFIGSHIVDSLIGKNNITILDNLSTGFRENINKRAKFVKGDVRDYRIVEKLAEDKNYIFHLAAQTSVPESVKFPEKCFDINLNGMINIIKSSLKCNIKR